MKVSINANHLQKECKILGYSKKIEVWYEDWRDIKTGKTQYIF